MEAAWVGGGAAFGRVDRWSDVDFQIVCDAEHAEAAFAAIEAALPIELTVQGPGPLRQRFYRLRGEDPHLFVDFCVIPRSELAPYLDPARHGQPRVLFDRTGVLVPKPDVPELDVRLRRAVARFRFFARVMIERNVGREKKTELAGAWVSFVLTPLVEVLRAVHSPERQDFGLRYTDIDLPQEIAAELERIVAPSLDNLSLAESLFDRAVDELVRRGPASGRWAHRHLVVRARIGGCLSSGTPRVDTYLRRGDDRAREVPWIGPSRSFCAETIGSRTAAR